MTVKNTIETKLTSGLDIHHLEVINESNQHNVPAGSESHFKVVIASNDFDGKNLITRHRMVNQLLADELQNSIHALALHTYTLGEWEEKQNISPESPPCLGGGKS